MAGPQPKKAQFTLWMDDDAEMTSLHSKLDAIAVQLGPQATRKTALWHLIDSYSSSGADLEYIVTSFHLQFCMHITRHELQDTILHC